MQSTFNQAGKYLNTHRNTLNEIICRNVTKRTETTILIVQIDWKWGFR